MKISMKWLLLAIFAVATMNVSAQQKPIRLGHIESGKLIQAMPEMAEVQKTFQAKQEEVQKESQNLREQYQKLVMDYTQNEKGYSEIIRTSKQREIEELGQRIQQFEQLAMQELERAQGELFQPVMDKATQAIKDVAKENGFTYVFDMSSGSILYAADNSEDILPLVMKKLNIN